MTTDLASRTHWIFDLDGTLTVPVHDFDAIRAELDLPPERGILESLEAMPPSRAEPVRRRLDAIELELAAESTAAPGASELLEALAKSGIQKGIVTRNSTPNLETTLRAIGFLHHFDLDHAVTRDCPVSRPKPAPDGILTLLSGWGVGPERAVMVGNHAIDVAAGRAAGALTVLVDHDAITGTVGSDPGADIVIRRLDELLALSRL